MDLPTFSIGRKYVPMEGLDPGFRRLRAEGVQDPATFWFWVRASCEESDQGGYVSWDCESNGCSVTAAYPWEPSPDAPEAVVCKAPHACERLAKGDLKVAGDGGKLEKELGRVGRNLSAELAQLIRDACRVGACSPSVLEAGKKAEALAASDAWRALPKARQAPGAAQGESARGGVVSFKVSDLPGTVDLRCAEERETDDPDVECGLELHGGPGSVRYSMDSASGSQDVSLEGGELTAHDGAVYLTSRALKMQTP
ncbi:MAG: hypothetical protein WBV82_05870 [Myxococcaceae bacterium]